MIKPMKLWNHLVLVSFVFSTAFIFVNASVLTDEKQASFEHQNINVSFIDAYRHFYCEYQEERIFEEAENIDYNPYEKFDTAKQRNNPKYSFLFQDTTKPEKVSHFLYAYSLENYQNLTEGRLRELVVFVNTKVAVFLLGVNYANGSMLLNPQSKAKTVCDLFARDMLQFGVIGVEEVSARLIQLLRELNNDIEHPISNILSKGVAAMWEVMQQLGNSEQFSKNNNIMLHKDNEENYLKLVKAEENLMNEHFVLLTKVLETIKLKLQSQPSSCSKSDIVLTYAAAKTFWDEGGKIYSTYDYDEDSYVDEDVIDGCNLLELFKQCVKSKRQAKEAAQVLSSTNTDDEPVKEKKSEDATIKSLKRKREMKTNNFSYTDDDDDDSVSESDSNFSDIDDMTEDHVMFELLFEDIPTNIELTNHQTVTKSSSQ